MKSFKLQIAEKTTSYISSSMSIIHPCEWEADSHILQSCIWALLSAFYIMKEVVFYDFMLMWSFDKAVVDS